MSEVNPFAGTKSRRRFNVVPRGKPLYEDSNRLGTKILEKMGWTKGKGLGAKEDGPKDFIRIKYKNDAIGLGFIDRDDQWTEHEKQFEGILASLHNSKENSEEDDQDEENSRIGFGFQAKSKKPKIVSAKDKVSGESLEEKSKNMKSRLHYRKFTKGKDLTQYSEKDLANIFGKKCTQESESSYVIVPSIGEPIIQNKEAEEKMFGVQTINTSMTVTEYFQQKMEEMKNKKMQFVQESHETIVAEPKKSKKHKRNDNDLESDSNKIIVDEDEPQKKKKKKSKHKGSEEVPQNLESSTLNGDKCLHAVDKAEELLSTNVTEKRKKKKGSKTIPENDVLNDTNNVSSKDITVADYEEDNLITSKVESETIGKRKKSKKHKSVDSISDSNTTFNADMKTSTVSVKNVTEQSSVLNGTTDETIPLDTESENKKNKRKSKKAILNCEVIANSNDDQNKETGKHKKSKQEIDNNTTTTENANKSKKKQKHKKKIEESLSDNIKNSMHETESEIKNIKTSHSTNNNISSDNYKEQIVDSVPSSSVGATIVEDSQNNTNPKIETKLNESQPSEIKEENPNFIQINTYIAEVFRQTDFNQFVGANISDIIGYGQEKNSQIKVVPHRNDLTKIADLWDEKNKIDRSKLISYNNPLCKYAIQVNKARKYHTAIPKISLKKKSVFLGL